MDGVEMRVEKATHEGASKVAHDLVLKVELPINVMEVRFKCGSQGAATRLAQELIRAAVAVEVQTLA